MRESTQYPLKAFLLTHILISRPPDIIVLSEDNIVMDFKNSTQEVPSEPVLMASSRSKQVSFPATVFSRTPTR